MYYDREGRPLTLDEWAVLMDDPEYRRVDETLIEDRWWVSTVWLGLDHGYLPGYAPLIFETMVFDHGRDGARPEDRYLDLEQERYSTEAAARAGHDQVVAKVREQRTDHND